MLRMSRLKDPFPSQASPWSGHSGGLCIVFQPSPCHCFLPASAREPCSTRSLHPGEGPVHSGMPRAAVFDKPCPLHSHVAYVCAVSGWDEASPFVALFNPRSTSVTQLWAFQFCRKFSSKVSAQHPTVSEGTGCKTLFRLCVLVSPVLPQGCHPHALYVCCSFPFFLADSYLIRVQLSLRTHLRCQLVCEACPDPPPCLYSIVFPPMFCLLGDLGHPMS